MIKWIDAKKRLPEASGPYLVWFDLFREDLSYSVLKYSTRHKTWNCEDYEEYPKHAINDVKSWAELNPPRKKEKKQ